MAVGIWVDNILVIAIKYICFAGIATSLNLWLQYISLLFYQEEFSLYIAMGLGTAGGLLIKYLLDKHYIFKLFLKGKKENGKNFILYSFTGIFTTGIFWSMELLFDLCIDTEWAKYTGAIVGLSIGYMTKYFLDKKYVFIKGTDEFYQLGQVSKNK